MFDDTPFKLNRNIQRNISIQENTSGKKTSCEKYRDETNDVLTKFIKEDLKKEESILFSNKIHNKLDDFKVKIFKYYDRKIQLCDEAITTLDRLLELEDLFDFNIDINTIKKIPKTYNNPKPLNFKDNSKNLQLAILLIEDDFNDFSDLSKWLKINVDITTSDDVMTNLKNNLSESAKYWQFTYEIALQLSESTCDFEKFFEPNKLLESFVIPYQKELFNKTGDTEKAIKIFGKTNWDEWKKNINTILSKKIYHKIYTEEITNWVDSIEWPYIASYSNQHSISPSIAKLTGGVTQRRGAQINPKNNKSKNKTKNNKSKSKTKDKKVKQNHPRFNAWDINSNTLHTIEDKIKYNLGVERFKKDKTIIGKYIYKKFLKKSFFKFDFL